MNFSNQHCGLDKTLHFCKVQVDLRFVDTALYLLRRGVHCYHRCLNGPIVPMNTRL